MHYIVSFQLKTKYETWIASLQKPNEVSNEFINCWHIIISIVKIFMIGNYIGIVSK